MKDSVYFKYDWLVAIGVFIVAALIRFHRILPTITSNVIGPAGDNLQYIWNMWWASNAFSQSGVSLNFSNYIFYPEGTSLYFHSFSFYNLGLTQLLSYAMSPIAAYNVAVMHTFVLGGLGAFLLARYFIKNSYIAVLCGYIFAFNPSHYAHALSHINIASIQFVPFFVLYFVRAVKERTRATLALAAAFFLLNALCDWTYMIFALYFMTFGYVYLMIRRRRIFLGDVATKIGIVMGSALLILSPWLGKMVWLGLTTPGLAGEGHDYFVGDLAGLVTPDVQHPLAQSPLVQGLNQTYSGNLTEATVYLGISLIFLIVINWKGTIRSSAKYLIAVIPFMLLTLGTTIHVAGKSIPIILPYQVLEYVPFLGSVRAPSRHIVYVYLFLAIIVGMVVNAVYQRFRAGKYVSYLIVGIVALILVDFARTANVSTAVSAPACYRSIPAVDASAAILDLPRDYVNVCRYMMYQTFHHHPLVDGWASRKIGKSLIEELDFRDLSRQKEQLSAARVKYIVIHKDLLPPESKIYIDRYRAIYPTFYEDATAVILKV
jgi:hypothetical protein